MPNTAIFLLVISIGYGMLKLGKYIGRVLKNAREESLRARTIIEGYGKKVTEKTSGGDNKKGSEPTR